MKTKEIGKKIEKALPELEAMIKEATQIDITGRLQLELETTRRGDIVYRISSNQLNDLLNPLTRQIFKDILIHFWGGSIVPKDVDVNYKVNGNENAMIWYSPHVSYNHVIGGSNGCKIIWESIWFDLVEEKWIVR